MSSKEFCESGKHVYKEIDIVRSTFDDPASVTLVMWIVVACSKCDSKFLREVSKDFP